MSDDLDEPFFAYSRYAIPRGQALDEIKKRKAELLNSAAPVPPPEPDLEKREAVPIPEPLPLPPPPEPTLTEREDAPIVIDPDTFAQQFWGKRKKPSQKSPHPSTRKPKGSKLTDKHRRFGVIDGDGEQNE
jgi:hypothetical protein